MSLYRWELQKIWKRRSARVALALMLVWTMAGILVNAFYNNSYKVDGVTPCVPGPQEIANQLAWAEPWRGELTGAQLAAAQTTVYDLYRDPANRGPDGEVTNEAWNAVVRPMGSMTNTLMNIAAGVYGLPYAAETIRYIELLGQLNAALCARADAAYESVCGILLPVKEGETR